MMEWPWIGRSAAQQRQETVGGKEIAVPPGCKGFGLVILAPFFDLEILVNARQAPCLRGGQARLSNRKAKAKRASD
jgi:hypothetical protein